MIDLPRRTISELLLLHEIESSLRDVFVEGEYDVAIVSQFLHEKKRPNVVVRSINCVDIGGDILRSRGRNVGNRDRLIVLAEETSRIASVQGRILCVADKDYAGLVEQIPEVRDLAFTDYTSMDLYAWNQSTVGRFLRTYCGRLSWRAEEFMEALREPLQMMFAIRLAAQSLGLKISWVGEKKCIELKGWLMVFDAREFLIKLANKNKVFPAYP